MGICITLTCFQTLRARKCGFLHETEIFLFHIDRYHFDGPSSSESKEPRFRLLEIEANAVIYIHPKLSNELGLWRREPRLVMVTLLMLVCAVIELFTCEQCCNHQQLRSSYSKQPKTRILKKAIKRQT